MEKILQHEQANTLIYRVPKGDLDFPLGMKVLNVEYPSPDEIRQFYNEFEVLKATKIEHVREVLDKKKIDNRYAITFKWFEGYPIKEVFKDKKEDVRDFLYVAKELANTLASVHEKEIIHKDISSNNILVDLQNRKVCLIDFGIANTYSTQMHDCGNPELLQGTLNYMSPEQTGRMNRKIDHRSDLYSLGVVFYEILTGQLPFISDDPLEIVHGHIAKEPESVFVLNPKVPEVISQIISKLLKKNAEERYQSAIGLGKDLERCLKEYAQTGSVSRFELAKHDNFGKFVLAQKLYGRKNEISQILNGFDRCSSGEIMLMLVSGYSGTGKSAVVHEVHKKLAQRSGYFAEGKFDQFQRAVPYYAFIQAFESLIRVYLTEGEEKLGRLRDLILQAVGDEGKVLTDIIPDLTLIIGEQPPVPELRGTESQNRFNYLIRKFVQAVTKAEHPLVIFIDDLQWADSSSLGLLKLLMTDPDGGHFMCVGAYRDNEVDSSHPFSIKIEEIKRDGCEVEEILLENLSLRNVDQLIKDSIGNSDEAILDLSELVYEKNKGNAFFVTQLLKSIAEEGLLYFDFYSQKWEWDIEKIRLKNITDNVVDILTNQIQNLPEDCQFVLKKASCIGATFDIEILAIASGLDRDETESALLPALKKTLIIPLDNTEFKFSHDRIQQSMYSMIPVGDRNSYHYELGKLLLNNSSEEQLENYLFDIVNHYNIGSESISNPNERKALVELNLRATAKAKTNSAFEAGLSYAKAGIKMLSDNAWKKQYHSTLALYTYATELAYLTGSFEEMEAYFQDTVENATSTLDKIKPFEVRILAYKAENKLKDSIKTGLEILELLDVKFPRKITKPVVFASLISTMVKLRGKSNDDILALPELKDPSKKEALRIMADIASSSYWAYPELLPMIAFKMIGICLKHGNAGVSAFAFAGYGVILCGVLGLMKMGYRFGQLGLALLEKYDAKEWKTQIYDPVYALINNWNGHVRHTFGPLQESYHIGLETGEIEFACINTNIYCINAYLCGLPLPELEEQTRSYSKYFKDFQQMTNYHYNEVYRQGMLNLMGRSENPKILTGEAYDEEVMLAQNKENNDHTGTFFIYFNKLILYYHFREYEAALDCVQKCRSLYQAVLAKFEIPNLVLYEGLTYAALADKNGVLQRQKYLYRINTCIFKLKNWSRNAPENFKHKYQLLQAEKARIQGRFQKARSLYDQAIHAAAEQQFINEEALACELAARFNDEKKQTGLAEYYFKAAYNKYREWGAIAKMRFLEKFVPHYLTGLDKSSTASALNNTSTTVQNTGRGILLDVQSLIKAFTKLSKEVKLEDLLAVLMRIVSENAGARKGYLLLKEEDQLFMEARLNAQTDAIKVLEHIPVEEMNDLSTSIIQYVQRTKDNVVVHDAINDVRFNNDEYISSQQPKSILCIPIVNLGKPLGILYLENNLTKGAFTKDRIELLSLLSGQIAVSIDNASLYNNLERKVSERTEELHREKAKSDQLLLNILPAETMEELKKYGKTLPRSYEKVTVLFTDFVGFTTISARMSPEELVSLIDKCFSAFDKIVEEHKIEKIKTIGDAYMAVGGLPIPNSTHAVDCAKAALVMRDWMTEFNKKQEKEGKETFQIRIGLHTGPVVAGVVGNKKFAYDIWGDTVNTASRMESSGEAGEVNVSEDTYSLIKDHFDTESRGKIHAKNKGEIEMYFLKERTN
jgi:predicted ATPase/class 3 adenylate cyclase